MASITQMMQAATPDPVADLPRFSDVARPVQGNTTRNPLAAGISSGIDQLQGTGGAFVAALGDILGSEGIKSWGVGVAQRNAAEAAKNGRADLSRPLWEQNLSDVPAWLGFRTAQQVPQMAVQLAGGAALGRGLAKAGAALPDSVAEVGARVPKVLGGGGAGFEGAVSREALDQGRKYATDVAGATVAGYPMAVGSLYGEAIDRGDPNRGDAFAAAIAAPAYAALDAMGPVQLKQLVQNGSKGKLASRLLTGVFAGAAAEAPQEAVQTAMELAFRPDLSPQEKFKNILDAAVTGAAIGGFLGGGAGIRRTKSPSELTNDEAKTNIDTALGTAKGPAPDLKLDPNEPPEAPRPHAKEPVERVQSMLADVESRMMAGGGTQQDAINRKQLRDEIAARTAEAQPDRPLAQVEDTELATAAQYANRPDATDEQKLVAQQAQAELQARAQEGAQLQAATKIGPNQPGPQDFDTPILPGFADPNGMKMGKGEYQLPVQRSPEAQYKFEEPARMAADAAVAAKAEASFETTQAAQRKVADLMGLKSIPKEFDKRNIQTEEDGFAYIQERLNKGNASDAVIRAGKEIGLLDENGNDQTVENIQQKLAANKERATSIMQKAKLTGAKQYTVQLKKMSEENQKLTAQLDLVRRTGEAVKLRDRMRNPPTEITPGPAQMRMPDGKMTSVTVMDSAPTNVEGKLFQAIKNEKGVEAFVPIETLYSSSVPAKEATAATSPAAPQAGARGPAWNAQQKAEAAAAMDRKRPLPVPQDLKAPLWQNTEQGRELTPPPPRGEVDTFTTPQETDQQRLARRAVEGQYFAGEQEFVPTEWDEERAASRVSAFKRYAPLLAEIVRNKKLPVSLRQRASRARDAIRTGGGTELVREVLADYSSQTGDMQFQKSSNGLNMVPERLAAVTEEVFDSGQYVITVQPDKEGFQSYNYTDKDSGRVYRDLDSEETQKEMEGELTRMRYNAAMNVVAMHKAQEIQTQAANPDGPFADAEMNVAATEGVPQKYADYLRDLTSALGLDGLRIFVYTANDIVQPGARAKYGLYGSYWAPRGGAALDAEGAVGPMGMAGDFHIMLNDTTSELDTVETLTHEVGHIIKIIAMNTASDTEYAALQSNYNAWKAERLRGTVGDLKKSLRATAGRKRSNTTDTTLVKDMDPEDRDYYTSYDEYFADMVAKWALTSKKPRSIIEKFFSKLANKLRALAALVMGKDPAVANDIPDEAIKAFLDRMADNPALSRLRVERWKLNPKKMEGMRTMIAETPSAPNVKAANWRLGKLMGASDGILEKIKQYPLSDASDKMNIAHLWTTTINHIVDYFGPLFKEGTLARYRDTLELQRGLANRMAHLQATGYQMWETLSANPKFKAAADMVLKSMDATFSDIDPRKKWDDHKHLHDMPNADVLKARVLAANETYRNMQRIIGPDGRRASDVYDTLLASNEMERYASQTVALYNLVKGDASVVQSHKDGLVDPVVQFMQDPKVFEDPMAAREYWRAQRDALVTSTKKYVEDQLGRLGSTTDANAKKARKSTDTLANFVKMIDAQDVKMQQAPYFHVGRFGDYFASYRVKVDKEGNVDQTMLQQMAKAIETAGLKLSVPVETTVDRMFFRFETQDEANRFEELMKQFEKKGFITREPREGQTEGQDPKLGKRGDSAMNKEPKWASALVSQLKANFEEATLMDDLSDEQIAQRKAIVNQYESQIHQFFMNMIPDSSLLKVNLQRYGVAGFSPDMMRAYAFRSSLGADALATSYTAPKMTDALKTIRAEVDNAKVLGETDAKTRYTMQNVLFELMKRESNRAVTNKNTFFDMWRAVNHNYFLGLSPSYALTQLVSISSLLWPRLAAKHGFWNAAKAIGRVTPTAFKIVKATIQHGYEGTWAQAFDATINSKVLKEARVSGSDVDYMLRLASAGLFDMGSQSRELGRVTEGNRNSKFDTGMRIASSFGYYSEMIGRVTAALAAKELHGSDKSGNPNPGLDQYARDTIVGSMFEFSNWNTPRAFGRDGIIGAGTPVAFSFMNYSQQLIETLSREIGKAYFKGAERQARGDKKLEAELKKEARRFLGAHLVGVGAVAGSLGLPAASMIAVVINNMVDVLGDDDEPFDAKIAYRRYLSSIFGEGVAEVIARGLPRAIGFDISNRVGEADILPFTRLLADRRQFGEAFDSYTSDMLGAPVSMVRNIGEGAAQILNGNLVEGSRVMMPMALKGMLGAYQLSDKGYVDKKGNALPMSPDAVDMLYQLVGLTPAGKAEYDEQYRAYQATRGEMIRLSSKYRKDLASAIENNDMSSAQELMDTIRQFDANNPDYAVLPSIGQVLSSRARERSRATGSDAPLGIKPGLADQYTFGNVR